MVQLRTGWIAGLAVLVFIASFSVFTVDQRERAIMFRLGEIVRTDFEPGLHFKVPVWNNVRKFDARIQTLETDPERYLTIEKKNVEVDSFVKWRITDVARLRARRSTREARKTLQLLPGSWGPTTQKDVRTGHGRAVVGPKPACHRI